MTTTAATAISAAISPYSIAVTPRLSVIRQYRDANPTSPIRALLRI
jgi:hypothetical protein